MADLDAELTRLIKLWQEVVSVDHHKGKDGYFSITKSWDWDGGPRYYFSHHGYHADSSGTHYEAYVATNAEAMRLGIAFMKGQLQNRIEWANRASADPDDWSQHEAKKVLEILKDYHG